MALEMARRFASSTQFSNTHSSRKAIIQQSKVTRAITDMIIHLLALGAFPEWGFPTMSTSALTVCIAGLFWLLTEANFPRRYANTPFSPPPSSRFPTIDWQYIFVVLGVFLGLETDRMAYSTWYYDDKARDVASVGTDTAGQFKPVKSRTAAPKPVALDPAMLCHLCARYKVLPCGCYYSATHSLMHCNDHFLEEYPSGPDGDQKLYEDQMRKLMYPPPKPYVPVPLAALKPSCGWRERVLEDRRRYKAQRDAAAAAAAATAAARGAIVEVEEPVLSTTPTVVTTIQLDCMDHSISTILETDVEEEDGADTSPADTITVEGTTDPLSGDEDTLGLPAPYVSDEPVVPNTETVVAPKTIAPTSAPPSFRAPAASVDIAPKVPADDASDSSYWDWDPLSGDGFYGEDDDEPELMGIGIPIAMQYSKMVLIASRRPFLSCITEYAGRAATSAHGDSSGKIAVVAPTTTIADDNSSNDFDLSDTPTTDDQMSTGEEGGEVSVARDPAQSPDRGTTVSSTAQVVVSHTSTADSQHEPAGPVSEANSVVPADPRNGSARRRVRSRVNPTAAPLRRSPRLLARQQQQPRRSARIAALAVKVSYRGM
jgi:hypothetical protein